MVSVVVGLGNIGREYEGTRHNLGFVVLGQVAEKLEASGRPATDLYRWAEASTEAGPVYLIQPTTYMNRSGLAVAAFLERQDIDRAELLVVCDDFNLPLGRLRFRPGGSDGGQKGLRSVAEHIGTEEFKRLRLGVGPLPEGADPVEFVLGSFDTAEIEIVQKTVAVAAEGVIFAVHHRFDEVMGQYNTNNNPALPDSE